MNNYIKFYMKNGNNLFLITSIWQEIENFIKNGEEGGRAIRN